MMNDTLWTYWEEENVGTPPLVNLCLESIKKHNPTTIVLDKQKLRDLGGGEPLDRTEGRQSHFRSDLVRFWLLKEFGGAWLDADYLCLNPVTLFKPLEDPEVDFVTRMNGVLHKIASNAIASRDSGVVVTKAYKFASRKLRKKSNLGAMEIGPALLRTLYGKNSSRTVVLPAKDYAPVERGRLKRWGIRRIDEEHESVSEWYADAVGYHVTFGVIKQYLDWDYDRLFSSDHFMGFLLRKIFPDGSPC